MEQFEFLCLIFQYGVEIIQEVYIFVILNNFLGMLLRVEQFIIVYMYCKVDVSLVVDDLIVKFYVGNVVEIVRYGKS